MNEIYRESDMSAHVLLNLLNEFGKRDKMRGLRSNVIRRTIDTRVCMI